MSYVSRWWMGTWVTRPERPKVAKDEVKHRQLDLQLEVGAARLFLYLISCDDDAGGVWRVVWRWVLVGTFTAPPSCRHCCTLLHCTCYIVTCYMLHVICYNCTMCNVTMWAPSLLPLLAAIVVHCYIVTLLHCRLHIMLSTATFCIVIICIVYSYTLQCTIERQYRGAMFLLPSMQIRTIDLPCPV